MTFNEFLLTIRPLIKASKLEKAAGVPSNTLGKHYRYADGKPDGNQCPQKHFKAIMRVLRAAFVDIEIDGLSITCDQEGNKHNNDQRCAPM